MATPPRANLSGEEPDAGNLHVRVCEGWGRQRPHLLGDGLAGRGDAALMERREDRARADGVHTNALRRMVGGERPRQARDRGLGGVVLQVAAACYDGTYGGDVDRGARTSARRR